MISSPINCLLFEGTFDKLFYVVIIFMFFFVFDVVYCFLICFSFESLV
jgi:hypothetical protein